MRLLVLLLALAGAAAGIVIPPESTGDDPLAIVIVQGAFVHPEQYVDLGKALQAASVSPLWVGIAEGFLDNCPNPLQISGAVKDVVKALGDAGMPPDADLFLSGHSLGTVFVPAVMKDVPATGLLLFAGYLTTPLAEFEWPVLHLSGTLDGQTRPTRIAKTYAELEALVEEDPDAPLKKPVVLLEAVDHAHFFTGELPSSVAKNDVRSELDGAKARRQLAAHSVAFMEVARGGAQAANASALLRHTYETTGEWLAPLYDLQRREADADASEWAAFAQQFLLNTINNSAVEIAVDSVHVANLVALQSQDPATSVNVTTTADANIVIFSSLEFPLNPLDVSLDPITSSEIAVKMASRELLASLLPSVDFGAQHSCRDLNEAALQAALAAAPSAARQRFERRGKPMQFADDRTSLAEPLWIAEQLHLTYGDSGLQVQSVAFNMAIDATFYPGTHYCKLLAPSRALEYIFIDGLRGTEP